ncbi:MAG: hypothetical protein PHR64_00505 [Candidatus Shapirobacteria bacterium]|nr:hypothetical protein [Candidatus Shapirobacteria bacterium]MDD5481418.1 hypothetical protein [Candidatus Shapirobacteria bacterium]
MNKTKANNDWLIIAVFVLICALTWAITNTYHHYVNKKEVVAQKELLVPLDPKIDQDVFDTLESRTHPEEEELIKILSGSKLGVELPKAETIEPETPQIPDQPILTPTPPTEIETTEIP